MANKFTGIILSQTGTRAEGTIIVIKPEEAEIAEIVVREKKLQHGKDMQITNNLKVSGKMDTAKTKAVATAVVKSAALRTLVTFNRQDNELVTDVLDEINKRANVKLNRTNLPKL